MSNNSTIGRATTLTFSALGLGVRTLATVAPSAADRAVLRLFCTPMQRTSAARNIPPDATLELIPFENGELAVWSLGSGPAVLLAHGWAGSADDLVHFAGVFRRAGYRAVIPDMPAHGRSSGKRSNLPQLSRALLAVTRQVSPEGLHAVIGHSLGGAALTLALRDGLLAERAVLVAPPARPAVYMNRLTAALGLPDAQRKRSLDALAELAGGSLDLVSAVEAARTLLVPALVVHDRRDREVSWDDGREIAESWPRAQLLTTEGLGHRRLLSDGAVLEAALEFVRAESPQEFSAPVSRDHRASRRSHQKRALSGLKR